MTISDEQTRALLVLYQPPPSDSVGDWEDVLARRTRQTAGRSVATQRDNRRTSWRKRWRFGLAVSLALMVALAVGVQQGWAQRVASYFSGDTPPAHSSAALKIGEARFQKFVGPHPQLQLTSPREIAQFPTPNGAVHWYAAPDAHYRGMCQLAVRAGHSIGAGCLTFPNRWVWTIGSSSSIQPAMVVSGILPRDASHANVLLANGHILPTKVNGRIFVLVLNNRRIEKQITGFQLVQSDGHILLVSKLGLLGDLMRTVTPTHPGIFHAPGIGWLDGGGGKGAAAGF